MEIYLIRHGESLINVEELREKLKREEFDAGLTEAGRHQAQRLADWLPENIPSIDALYTSTMKRALETCEYVEGVYKIKAATEDRLREFSNNYADHTAIPGDTLPEKFTHISIYEKPFAPIAEDEPNIESWSDFRVRVGQFLEELIQKHMGQVVMLVSHGGVVNVVLDTIFNAGMYRQTNVHVKNTSITHFEYMGLGDRETWRLYSIGQADHLVEGSKPINLPGFLEPTMSALGVDLFPQTTIVDAQKLAAAHHPPFPPSSPALIAQIHSPKIAAEVKAALQTVYPDEHGVKLVYGDGKRDVVVENLPLHKIDHSEHIGYSTVLYIPPLDENTAFEDFQELIAHLRSPQGCPWDREQTHQTLRPNLLEETYEVLDALDQDDSQAMQEEFGDLLLQIVLHAQIASEYGEFTMSDIIQGIYTKLVRRHPHVFGDVELNEADAVIQNWERLKAHEREQNSQEEKGLLDSIASAMPALAIADAYQKRAARVGFDWPDIQGVIDKVKEELGEFEEADDPKAKAEEFGDLLFSLVNLARWQKIDPETALRETNTKFKTRFSAIEADANMKGVQLSDMTLDEMDAVWNRAKN